MGSFPETYNAKIYRFKSLSGPVKTGFESLVLYVYQLWSPQNLFRPLVPQFGLKIRGTAPPPPGRHPGIRNCRPFHDLFNF